MANADNQTIVAGRRSNVLSQTIAKKIKHRIERVLSGIEYGQISLTWPDGTTDIFGKRSERSERNVSVILNSYLPLRRLTIDGQLGFAEGYMRGEWSTDNLFGFFSLCLLNEKQMTPVLRGGRLFRSLNKWRHWTKRNSLVGSQKNIAYHYDLGNEFYKLWLDQSMSYSSALYHNDSDSLADAQQHKLDAILALIDSEAGANILEIGCGWGSLSKELACKTAANVTGISLSLQQLAYAEKHKQPTSLNATDENGTTRFEYCDYRDVKGKFDHIVSIEMFEAVGEQYWETYFNKLSALLDSGGTAVIQTITIAEERFAAYRKRPDFIQRYIFPGGMLPTKTLLTENIARAGFALEQQQWFGDSYAKTLVAWREKFEQLSKDVISLNFDERFLRMWRYYLNYCQAGFDIGHTDVGLVKIRKL